MKAAIRWMASHRVSANLLMMVLIVGGLIMGVSIKQEIFPEIAFDMVQVTVAYPGAGPEEVEEGIILKIEENLSAISSIKEVTSVAAEGFGMVTAELLSGEDPDLVMLDIKGEVDRITTFPGDAEKPIISKLVNRSNVIRVVIAGTMSERSLREHAEAVKDDLLTLPTITQAELGGVRPYEISIEVPESNIRRYGLTLDEIARRIRSTSVDLPAGAVKTTGGEILLRTKEKRYTGAGFSDITVIENPDGSEVRLGEIANVKDAFRETDTYSTLDGERAAIVTVYRVGAQKPIEISRAVKKYIEEKRLTLPGSVKITYINDMSEYLEGRMNLLIKNALLGLVLVFIVLGLFLQIRLALWVMLGIPISFLGAICFMPALGVSINMLSLFAFILALGIVVDDAIVVGENIFEHRTRSKNRLRASIDGAIEVHGPVIFSILTTIVAFMPLLFIDGMMGKFIKTIPLVVIPILFLSLVESLFILPMHLGHSKGIGADRDKKPGALERIRRGFAKRMEKFIDGPYLNLLRHAIRNRYITLASTIAILIISIGIIGGGIVKFSYMPEVDGDFIFVKIEMPRGTPIEDTALVHDHILEKGYELVSKYDGERDDGGTILSSIFSVVGGTINKGNPGESSSGQGSANMAELFMVLSPSEVRGIAASEVTAKWREAVGEIAGVESVSFVSDLVSFGANVDIRISHNNFEILTEASERIKIALGGYPGVGDVKDNYSAGKRELKIKLRPEARTLGITAMELGRQVRGAFYGAEALRFQRGTDEIRVMVRYPESERKSLYDLENMRIRTPGGGEVPFSVAAFMEEDRGYSEIVRSKRRRVVGITATIDSKIANTEEVLADLKKTLLTKLALEYPGITIDLEGEDRERRDSTKSMKRGFLMALFIMFTLLAIPFRSYSQPLIVMAAIPFGLVGAVFGHLIMGFELSILSIFGLVALSGVLVNDSLLLIDYINRRRSSGLKVEAAVIEGGRRRFRPIVLTSLTTSLGLAPMIFETSVQAQFLIPMAISLGFGILFATAITLLLIPSLYLIVEDLRTIIGLKPVHEEVAEIEQSNN